MVETKQVRNTPPTNLNTSLGRRDPDESLAVPTAGPSRAELQKIVSATQSSTSLTEGLRSPDPTRQQLAIREIQINLKRLGLLDAEPNGHFGVATTSGMVAVQRLAGLELRGGAPHKPQETTLNALLAMKRTPERGMLSHIEIAPQLPKELQGLNVKSFAALDEIRLGGTLKNESRDTIRVLQTALNEALSAQRDGLIALKKEAPPVVQIKADGYLGPSTEHAIRVFQTRESLLHPEGPVYKVTGEIGFQTLAMLQKYSPWLISGQKDVGALSYEKLALVRPVLAGATILGPNSQDPALLVVHDLLKTLVPDAQPPGGDRYTQHTNRALRTFCERYLKQTFVDDYPVAVGKETMAALLRAATPLNKK